MKTFLKRIAVMVLAKYKSTQVGQIGPKDEIGRWIELLASLNNVRTIVEIGTWNGLGSSLQIAKGVRKSTSDNILVKQVIGVEVNSQMWKRASRNLRKDSFFNVLHGSLVETSSLDSTDLSEFEKDWFAEDLRSIESSPNVIGEIPNAIDLLILDGGEFSTYGEYQMLKSRVSKWLILDDTNLRKCKRVLYEAINIDGFYLVFSSNERNGVAVLSRRPLE